MLPALRQLFRATGDLLWPRTCLICGSDDLDSTSPAGFCSACRRAICTDPHAACPRCLSSIGPHVDATEGCPRCPPKRFHFRSGVRFGEYSGRLRDAILLMKSLTGDALADTLGRLWATERLQQLRGLECQLVVPIPLHWSRRWQRGYNQAEALARGLAHGLGLPMAAGVLRRVRATPRQTILTPVERRRNPQGAFRVSSPGRVKNLRILLVDDVVTTGATADAAAAVLLEAGAAQVDVAGLAHR